MRPSYRPFTCIQCRIARSAARPRQLHHSVRLQSSTSSGPVEPATRAPTHARPPAGPKATIDIRSIRQNPDLYAKNCLERNYAAQAAYPAQIIQLFEQWQARQEQGRALRERSNQLHRELGKSNGPSEHRDGMLAEARQLKGQLADIVADEPVLMAEIERLATAIPNLTSADTPRGNTPRVLTYINDDASTTLDGADRSHIDIGTELGLLDLTAAASTSGWGWYYLLDEAAQLEQALIAYALATATRAGWRQVSPPSMVYGHIAAACGFQPRDASGEQQIYAVAPRSDADVGRPELVLAGTAEIPLAAMAADRTLVAADLPQRRVAVSRCYRAEAGARGAETKGLYRVHEFTKVELFGWTLPDEDSANDVFDEMVDLQTEMLQSLGLHCRVLEMPSGDLGASATRKIDIEAYFPSRRDRNEGWGEVTSASICTDYQTRRLATQVLVPGEAKKRFPYTVNGTAMAVPRVLAALLENGWDEKERTVRIPEVLRPWMDGIEYIRPKGKK